MRKVKVTERFNEALASIYTEKLLSELRSCMNSIAAFPLMGSPDVQSSPRRSYGEDIRKLPVSPFVIIYRYEEAEDAIEFIALPHERGVR